MNLFAELRKRNVFRVLAAYLVGSWIVMQVIGFVADAAELPAWTDSFVLIVVLLGLPIVGIAAWALELTPDGVKATGSTEEMIPKPVGPVDYVLMASVAVVLALFAWQTFAQPLEVQVTVVEPTPEEIVEEQVQPSSIAVLPFEAISAAPEDVILGDGLAEELLNVLAQFPDLRVAGRTSSFSFRDQQQDIPAIGEALGVTHVLEGSIRRSGDQLRITAQLIQVDGGFHIWSETYDRPFTDILEIQDEIVRQIAQVLTIRLGATSYDVANRGTQSAAAYEHYLRGRALWAERVEWENRHRAVDAFRTATDIDPNFAAAWAAYARAVSYSGSGDESSWQEENERVRVAAMRALELDPDNAEAWAALNEYHTDQTRDWQAALEAIDHALELAPNAAYAQYQAGLFFVYVGEYERMSSHFRRAIALDPLNLIIRRNAIEHFIFAGRNSEAERFLESSRLSNELKIDLQGAIAYALRDAEGWRENMDETIAMALAAAPENPVLNDPRIQAMLDMYEAAIRQDRQAFDDIYPDALEFGLEVEVPASEMAEAPYLAGDFVEAGRLLGTITVESFFGSDDWYRTAEFEMGMRCQPGYHTLWELPGLPELAEIRRANGATGNLPLSGPECDEWLEGAAAE